MGIGRQVQLRCGNRVLSLADDTYALQASAGWRDEGPTLTLRVLVEPQTLAGLSWLLAPLEQMLLRARWSVERLSGDPVYIYSKTCDDLSMVAEIGSTWRRKRVSAGSVTVEPLTGTAAAPSAILVIRLVVDELWQRAAPAPALECRVGLVNLDGREDQGLTTYGGCELWAPRLRWSSTTGLTARFMWTYGGSGSNQLNMIRLSAAMRCYYGHGAQRFYIEDNGVVVAQTAPQSLVVGQTYEVVVRWSATEMAVFINGVKSASHTGTITWPSNPDAYRVLETDDASGTQHWRSIQVWSTWLSDTQISGLRQWGMPEPELAFVGPPADDKATNARYLLFNTPGHDAAPLRLLLDGASNYAQVLAAVQPLRQPLIRYECESGTLGANTASNSNSDASGGSQARWTPADSNWATRVTITLAAAPVNVADLTGDYRLYLAGYDSAINVQINNIRWRLVVAGQAEDWSEPRSFAWVGQRAYVDLGDLTIPPLRWPEETLAATTNVYASTYITLQIQTQNTTGSGGGTLDMDAIYLAPRAQIGQGSGAFTSARHMLLDWTGDAPTALMTADPRSLEFAAWGAWVGDDLQAVATPGVSGLLWLYWLREDGLVLPNDVCDVVVLMAPRWRY